MARKTGYMIAAVAIAVVAWVAIEAAPASGANSHMDKTVNREGCAACHSGRSAQGSGMLKSRREQLCYRCHSYRSTVRGRAATDIESVMRKFSHHPVEETSQYHQVSETLPARDTSQLRHVACQDCHLAHITNSARPWNGARGYRPGKVRGIGKGILPTGLTMKKADYEYEVCYLCHSEGADMGMDSRDVASEFDTSNPSFHPVEMEGKNKNVPSLLKGLNEGTIIDCSDCHGNNDLSGPKGPHGSDYFPLLLAEFRTDDGPESSQSYGLCYMCHDRMSILADESFKRHKAHLTMYDISCKGCHNSHGSRVNRHLIEFDPLSVTAASDAMGPIYIEGLSGMPKCYLNCHGADHNISDINGTPWPW